MSAWAKIFADWPLENHDAPKIDRRTGADERRTGADKANHGHTSPEPVAATGLRPSVECDPHPAYGRTGVLGMPCDTARAIRIPDDGLNENEIQRAVFSHLRSRGKPGIEAWHPKNGGIHQRGRHAGINSGLGVVSGIQDVHILDAGQLYCLELKSCRGKLSPEQIEMRPRMQRAGAIVGVAYGLNQSLAWLESHGLLRGKMT
jgi:hypothetical protein